MRGAQRSGSGFRPAFLGRQLTAQDFFTEAQTMQFDECLEGDYRVFVGAVEARTGDGYIAALVVSRIERQNLVGMPPASHREAFRDDSLACGHRWLSPDEAISYALKQARELIRSRSPALAC
jgi:hypothetical protein